jgi:transposase
MLLSGISFALGGEAGSRMGRLLHIKVSADTLLRLMRQTEAPDRTTPRVLGVDDWAWRKGRVYGTILVDLEQQQVVDLLPDRESASLANWLRDHPGVEIISRDRGGAYAEGARLGAPEAIQVADRWHLLKNLADALTVSYDAHQALLRQLHIVNEPSPDAPQAGQTEVTEAIPATQSSSDAPSRPLSPQAQMRQRRRQHWEHCFAQVHSLLEQGMTKKAVARELNLSIKTVRKYSRLPALPKKTSPKSGPRILDPYRAYLRERLGAEDIGHRQLWREIQMRGYAGGPTTVYEYTRHLRQELGLPSKPTAPSTCFTKPRCLTARTLAMLVLARPAQLSEADCQLITQAQRLHPDIATATSLAQTFAAMLRERAVDQLPPWLETVNASQLPSLIGFVSGIQRDYAAVRAAFELPWSNGQVEGQVNRLKFIKRQMYGRANFDLLRLRVLHDDS